MAGITLRPGKPHRAAVPLWTGIGAFASRGITLFAFISERIDDMPEYYLRSTCLFDYVLEYQDWNDATDDYFYYDEDAFPTDRCRFWDKTRDREITRAMQPMLERLNKALDDSLEAVTARNEQPRKNISLQSVTIME